MKAFGVPPAHVGHDVDPAVTLEIAAMVMEALHQLLLVRDRLQFDHREIAARGEIAGLVEHIGDAAGHPGGEIASGDADHHHDAAGHVFAAVIARPFHDRDRPGIAYREPFAGDAAEIAFAGDR